MIPPPPKPFRPLSRPALVVAIGLGIGIALRGNWVVWVALLLLALTAACVGHLWNRNRMVSAQKLVLACAMIIAVVAVGGLRMAAWKSLPANHIATIVAASDRSSTPQDVQLAGTISEPVETLSYGTRVILDVDSVSTLAATSATEGRIQVLLGKARYGNPAIFPTLRLGDHIQVTGELRHASNRRNPADFDYAAYLERQGVYGVVSVYETENVVFLSPTDNLLTQTVASARVSVSSNLHRYIRNSDARGMARALLLGDRNGIDPTIRTAFAETGLMHLLAVSGLHVLLVGFLLYRLLKPVLGRFGFSWKEAEVLRAIITLSILLFYVLMTGGAVSVQRAFIMAAIWIGATVFQRNADGLNTLGVAGVIVLLLRPAALFDVGFQLSFSAVAALIVLMPILQQWVPNRAFQYRLSKSVVGLVLTSVAATLGTAPVVLFHFGQLPLAGLILNIVAIPATAVTLFGSIGTALVGSYTPLFADAFAAVAELGASAMLVTSEAGVRHLDWSLLRGFVRDPLVVLSIVAALGALAFWLRPRIRWQMVGLGILFISLSAWSGIATGDYQSRLDVVFLDVGQGDATLVTFPNGKTMLIDAGIRDPYRDQGSRTILPHLRRYGIERLDALVITHADADHFGGALSVMEEVEVGQLIHNGHQKDNELWLETLRAADSLGVEQQIVQTGDVLSMDASVRIRVLHPTRTPQPWEDGNDASVVLRMEHGETSFLFTGDTEDFGESQLVSRYDSLLASTVVKVGHHGSRTSSTQAFVDAASDSTTAFAIVSVAKRNRYGLPNQEPMARWEATNASLLQTANEGAIWLRSNGQEVSRIDWR